MLDRQVLIRCLEDILFTYPEDKVEEVINEQGIRGRMTALSMPYLNMVGVKPGVQEISADVVAAVRARFKSKNRAFGWLVTPSSPEGTAELLKQQGFSLMESFAGLVCRDLAQDIPMASEMRVEEVTFEERHIFVKLHASRMGLPQEAMALLADALYFNRESPFRWRNYFCHRNGFPEPISTASMMYFTENPVAYLAGAVTEPSHRGLGAYTSLIAQRFADARADDMEAIVIQAVRGTSAPICAKLGFQEIQAQEHYLWSP